MIPEWKTIKEHGVPENNRSVQFITANGGVFVGFFKTQTKGKYKGAVFVEARQKNESNGMFGSYVNRWSTIHYKGGEETLPDIVKWDYLPMV